MNRRIDGVVSVVVPDMLGYKKCQIVCVATAAATLNEKVSSSSGALSTAKARGALRREAQADRRDLVLELSEIARIEESFSRLLLVSRHMGAFQSVVPCLLSKCFL